MTMHPSWQTFIRHEFQQDYFIELSNFLRQAYSITTVFPPKPQVFRAFTTDLNQIKVIILGQDPYHGEGQANGLAFSVHEHVRIPPSLQNIFKELRDDLGKTVPTNGDLSRWAEQGVLLLNNTLTVEAHLAGSHRGKGWEIFTEHAIQYLNTNQPHLVFILWGRDARSKKPLIDQSKHYIIESAHPSPLSAYHGFFGSKPFSRCNQKLREWNLSEINW